MFILQHDKTSYINLYILQIILVGTNVYGIYGGRYKSTQKKPNWLT